MWGVRVCVESRMYGVCGRVMSYGYDCKDMEFGVCMGHR